jgi:hypothetical protein
MLEPVSATVGILWLGYASVNAYARKGSAVSKEAFALREAATAVIDSAERSQALFGDKAAAISDLKTRVDEYSQAEGSDDDALAPDREAVRTAADFIRALPEGLPLPEFSIDPDGAISLDWVESKTQLFSLSIGPTNRLAYAWLDGADRGHGVAKFTGEQIPQRIIEGIRAIAGHGNAVVGS